MTAPKTPEQITKDVTDRLLHRGRFSPSCNVRNELVHIPPGTSKRTVDLLYGPRMSHNPTIGAKPSDVTLMIQNRSPFSIEISTGVVNKPGLLIAPNHAITLDVHPVDLYVSWDSCNGMAEILVTIMSEE